MKLIEKGFLQRNRRVFLISLIIFVVFSLIGAVFTFYAIGDKYGMISDTINNMTANNTTAVDSAAELTISNETAGLFIHNLASDLIVIAGGLLFSVISVLAVIFNAVSIGSPFGADLLFASAGILPHGIIEYVATIIALASAFNITKLEIAVIKNRSFGNFLTDYRTELKDILVLIIVIVVLLAVAAIIECNVTGLVIGWVYGIA